MAILVSRPHALPGAPALLGLLLLAGVAGAAENSVVSEKKGVEAFGYTWLDEAGPESSVAKSRARRFASFPTGSKLQAEITLSIPIEGLSDSGNLKLVHTLTFNLPNDTVSWARNYPNTSPAERSALYGRLETFLDGLGYDGHVCTLRTLCEIAESPFDHGVYGDVVNLVLSASRSPDQNDVYDEYMTAEYYGSSYGDCGSIYTGCPHSVLDAVSRMF
ncbi:uncharacterized protein LOC122266926 [Penaeus japonicus]|uniref:uncharacterized protein LOC122266926 n=1 Tax=Penaeus japonicus TaxID=27405 RepID=UPI001C70E6D3|nr:uncharacterized protein LOC122266926 [Penaeus japonicus]